MSNLAKYERSKLMQGANAFHHRVSRKGKELLEMARESGQRLNQLKVDTLHGDWLPYLESEFEGSRQTASRYMRIDNKWDEIQAKWKQGFHLGIYDAVKLLQPPKDNAPPPEDEHEQPESHPIDVGVRSEPTQSQGSGVGGSPAFPNGLDMTEDDPYEAGSERRKKPGTQYIASGDAPLTPAEVASKARAFILADPSTSPGKRAELQAIEDRIKAHAAAPPIETVPQHECFLCEELFYASSLKLVKGNRYCFNCRFAMGEIVFTGTAPDPVPMQGDLGLSGVAPHEPDPQGVSSSDTNTNGRPPDRMATKRKPTGTTQELQARIVSLTAELEELRIDDRRLWLLGGNYREQGCEFHKRFEFWKLFFDLRTGGDSEAV